MASTPLCTARSSTAPYAPSVHLYVDQASSTDTTVTFSWRLYYNSATAASTNGQGRAYSVTIDGTTVKSGTFNINGITDTSTNRQIASGTTTVNKGSGTRSISFGISFSFNITWSGVWIGTETDTASLNISAKTSWTVKYNANGGSGAPSSQTKQKDVALKLSTAKPARTGYTFKGWATSPSGGVSYESGANYTTNADVTLYAVWVRNTYTVTYNANGGSGAPSSQTKQYDINLTLSSSVPTRAHYKFLGWGTSASATTVTYNPGSIYKVNASVTLYAVWSYVYKIPTAVNVIVNRCNSDGTENDSGTYAKVSFDWSTNYDVTSITIQWKKTTDATWPNTHNVTASGLSGSVSVVVGMASLVLESSYEFRITVSDSGGSFAISRNLAGSLIPIDVKAKGLGVAFGKPAEFDNLADFAFDAKFNGTVYGNVLGLNRLPSIPSDSDLNAYINTGCYAVYQNAVAETIANIPVARAGRLEVNASTGEGIRLEQYSYIRQRYIPYDMANATWERDITRGTDNAWSYGVWYRTTLSSNKSTEVYHEQHTLWTGAYYMTAGHTIELSENITDQPNGIVLLFSAYTDGAAANNNMHCYFIPKYAVQMFPGTGHTIPLWHNKFAKAATKYLYINDKTITGHADNNAAGSGTAGVTYTNSGYVLRAVIGV